MHCCYILYSAALRRYYVGSTSDMNGRLRRHLSNHKGFTGRNADWEIKWKQSFESKVEALEAEKLIKSWKSRVMIEKLILREKF